MQTVIYAMAKPNQPSLRELIVSDLQERSLDGLHVVKRHKKGRPNGWAKINRKDSYGCLNLDWDATSKTMVGRVVSKAGCHPGELVAAFIAYLLRWHGRRICMVTVRSI
ncbi:MAG: hypothetical protein ABIJ09_24335 [Pseudomonadota bacterium]